MKRTLSIQDIFQAPTDDTSLESVAMAHRECLIQQIPPPANWRVLDAEVKSYAFTGETQNDPVRTADVDSIINTGKLEEDTDTHIQSLQNAMGVLYEEGNPDRVTVVTEVIEED